VFQTQNKNESWPWIKNIKIVFLLHRLWFFMKFFCHELSMFGHAHIFVLSLWFTLTQKCYTSDFHFIVCDYVKKTIENIKEPKTEICIILFSGFLMFFWQFCLVMLKMVTNCFANRNFMYSMKRLKRGLVFFFWTLGDEGDAEGISFVFSQFPMCSLRHSQ